MPCLEPIELKPLMGGQLTLVNSLVEVRKDYLVLINNKQTTSRRFPQQQLIKFAQVFRLNGIEVTPFVLGRGKVRKKD